jgi:S1-C subfamily serine protease
VFAVNGCGQTVTYRTFCTPTGQCAFRADPPPAPPAKQTAPGAEQLGVAISSSNRPMSHAANFARSYQSTVAIMTDSGLGTGFAVTVDGVIATNLHVVAGAERIRVKFVDEYEGVVEWVEGYEPTWDLVLLRINRNLNALPLDEHERTGIGEEVIAVGNPLGLQATVSDGVISGFRRIGTWDVVQVTTAISPGSSGGPILNRYGEVVAVATFLLKDGNGLGFGTPAKYVRSLLAHRKRLELAEFAQQTRTASAAP